MQPPTLRSLMSVCMIYFQGMSTTGESCVQGGSLSFYVCVPVVAQVEQVVSRFNPFLSEYVPLDEVRPEKISAMRADTRMYLRRNHNRVIEVCNQLQLPRKVSDRVKDFVAYTKMLRHWSHDPR